MAELPEFPRSIAQVETCLPAFIGYTEKAQQIQPDDLIIKPVRIGSLVEYEQYFGVAAPATFSGGNLPGEVNAGVPPNAGERYFLYDSIRLFYDNGGGDCYVVSIGNYQVGSVAAHFNAGLDSLLEVDGPTLILSPDSVNLSEDDLAAFQIRMLSQCAHETRRDRMAILDLKEDDPLGSNFRSNLGNDNLSFGMAYTPWLQTSYSHGDGGNDTSVPPSGAIAGIIAMTDNARGVWKAPANAGLSRVVKPMKIFTEPELNALNIDVAGGKSINVIRSFQGYGTLVWGARTLSGNDMDWRYISTRRFCMMVEKSVRLALELVKTESNDGVLWQKVKSQVENFLIILWREGGLQGQKPENACFVQVGLGQSMTQADVDAGNLIVRFGLAVSRPGEFIIIEITQKMEQQ
jgi:phage tail sheath protein FI